MSRTPTLGAVIWARTSPSPPDERDRAVLYSTDVVRRVVASGREAGMSDLGDLFVLHDTQPQFHPNSYIVHPSMYLYLQCPIHASFDLAHGPQSQLNF